MNRDTAIKILPAAFAQVAERVARFRREAQVLAALNHPNVAAIHGLEDTDDGLALALEYVDVGDLAGKQLVSRGSATKAIGLAQAGQA